MTNDLMLKNVFRHWTLYNLGLIRNLKLEIRNYSHWPQGKLSKTTSFQQSHRTFFFVLLLFLPTQLGLHLWPDFALVLGRRIDYLSPTLFFTDVLIFLTLGFWILEKPRQIIRWAFSKHVLTIGAVVLGPLFINVLFAANQSVAIIKAAKLAELILFGAYIVDTKPKMKSLLTPLSIATISVSVLAFVQFLLQHSVGGLLWFVGERTFTSSTPGIAQASLGGRLLLRPYATFPHPNVLAGFVTILFPLFALTKPKSRWQQKLAFITIVVSILVLPIAMSRSAWFVFTIMLVGVVFALIKRRTRQAKSTFTMITATVALALLFLSQVFVFRIQELLSGGVETIVQRQALVEAAVAMIRSNLLFGVGLNNFIPSLPDYVSLQSISFQLQPVHSVYLLLLSEVGVVGFVLAVLLVVASLFQVLRKKNWALLLSLVALLLLGLFDHYLFTLQQTQLLATILLALSFV